MRQIKIESSVTVRDSRGIELYLQEIAKIDMISQEEEVRLARLIKNGDEQALQKMVKANLRFVVSVAKKYQNKGLQLLDLINEGNSGLIEAAKRFDPDRGFKFISYAVWWIRQSIMLSLNEHSKGIRLPSNKGLIYSKVRQAMDIFEQLNEREGSPEEIYLLLAENKSNKEISLDTVKESFILGRKILSLDNPISSDSDAVFMDFIEDVSSNQVIDKMDQDFDKEKIELLLSQLPKKEVEIITKAFGINTPVKTLDAISAEMNLTRERVRQIKGTALRRMKHLSIRYRKTLELA